MYTYGTTSLGKLVDVKKYRKKMMVVTGWKVVSYEAVIYFNCIYFPNFLQACFTVALK